MASNEGHGANNWQKESDRMALNEPKRKETNHLDGVPNFVEPPRKPATRKQAKRKPLTLNHGCVYALFLGGALFGSSSNGKPKSSAHTSYSFGWVEGKPQGATTGNTTTLGCHHFERDIAVQRKFRACSKDWASPLRSLCLNCLAFGGRGVLVFGAIGRVLF